MRTVYDSQKRIPAFFEELGSIVKYRDLLYQLVRRDIVTRYKRSFLGIAWTMLTPLGMMLVLSLVFSQLFKSVPQYSAYLLSGLIAWIFFSQTTTAALTQNIWGASLLHRIYLPRSVFTVSSIGTGLVNLIISILVLIIILLVTRIPLHPSILFLPYSVLLLAAFALGIALLLSSLAVTFPDVIEMYQVALIAWMYLTPIIYPEEIIPSAYRNLILGLNPMYYLIQIFRMPIYDGVLPPPGILLIGSGIALFTLLLGWAVFTRNADKLNYRI
jgi:ABC-type polysaccharide/polyol phosphate export permease